MPCWGISGSPRDLDALEPGSDALEPGSDALEPGSDALEPGSDALESPPRGVFLRGGAFPVLLRVSCALK